MRPADLARLPARFRGGRFQVQENPAHHAEQMGQRGRPSVTPKHGGVVFTEIGAAAPESGRACTEPGDYVLFPCWTRIGAGSVMLIVPSQPPQLPHPALARPRRHEVTECVGRVIAARASQQGLNPCAWPPRRSARKCRPSWRGSIRRRINHSEGEPGPSRFLHHHSFSSFGVFI